MTKSESPGSESRSTLETGISHIRKLAKERTQENWDFRSMLKASDLAPSLIDSFPHEVYNEIKGKIDCTKCGYCCKTITPIISEADIKRIANYLNVSVKYAQRKWFKKHDDLGVILKECPCPFWENRKCSIYPARPHNCKSYPHLHKNGILRYITSIYSHIDLCPMVYHFYEGMKKKCRGKLDPQKITWL